jgi:hypothetical protein
MTATGTQAVEFQFMSLNHKPVLGCDLLLQTLNLAVLEFHDFPATRADEMVVVPFMRDIVILGLRAEVTGLSQAGLAEQIQRSVDCRKAQVRVLLGELMVHGFGRHMLLLQKGGENQFALAGQFQLMPGEVLPHGVYFLHILVHLAVH